MKPWIKCTDPEGIMPPCIFAIDPNLLGALNTNDLKKIGYIKCNINNFLYLAASIRPCKNYSEGEKTWGKKHI